MNSNITPIKKPSSKLGMWLSAILIVLLVGSVYISQLIFQEIAESFNIDHVYASRVFSLSCFFYAISFFIYGPLSDRVATKFLVLFGSIGTIVCLILSVQVQSFNLYLIIMSLIGFFAASVPSALFAYTAKNTPNDKLAQAMGLMISASIIGIIFSRSIVAIMTDKSSWQYAFVIYAAFIILASVFVPMGIKSGASNHSGIRITETYLLAGKLLLNKQVNIFLLVGFILFFVYLGLSSFLTIYLKGAPFYLSSTTLGWLNFAGMSAVIGAVITGKLSQKISIQKLLPLYLICVMAAVIIIGFSTHLLLIALGIFALFFFVFGIQPIVISMLNQIVPVSSRGAISSLYLLSCLAGGSIGSYILGILYAKLNWNGLIFTCIILAIINIALALLGIKLTRAKEN